MLGFSSLPMDTGAIQKSKQTQPSTSALPVEKNEGHDGVLARTAVSLEYASLRHASHCPLGLYVVPSSRNILIWDGVFFVHQGYYADSILKFRLTFPETYPESPPAVDFVTDIFHPLISQNGSFNLSPRFRPWRPKEHHVFDVLHWVKVAFKKHALDQFQESYCFNKEAFRFCPLVLRIDLFHLFSPLRYRESTQSFAALAMQSASLSQSESALFDADHPSPMGPVGTDIVFKKLNAEQFRKERSRLGLQEWKDTTA
ncbi:ubiquitin-conjugating enzyme/RWD-like protein [Crassisporium funariophilum]|nr:ubiquitin-conjugating enzyme/RWD-like protein [Crassisporium funariophilum]